MAQSSHSWSELPWVLSLCSVPAWAGCGFCAVPGYCRGALGGSFMCLFFLFLLCACVFLFPSLGIHRGVLEQLECISGLYMMRWKGFFLVILFKQRHERIVWYGHVSKGLGNKCYLQGFYQNSQRTLGPDPPQLGPCLALKKL